VAATQTQAPPVQFQTHPSRYRHWRFEVQGDIARLAMNVQQFEPQREGYELKLNSYDIGVDVELADCLQRLRFEHPQVRCVILTGSLERVFCAGANIVMLRTSSHGFKVNFCRFTNETRLAIEDASEQSGLRFLAALNGTASGGGYELALACDKILLVDDRNSAVSFPEVPLLGVLPGTGGLTRLTDKRKVRRDRCDVFSTLAEGIKGKRAVEWNLVDAIAPLSRWDESVERMARELADGTRARGQRGVELESIEPESESSRGGVEHTQWRHLELEIDRAQRTAALTLRLPDTCAQDEAQAVGQQSAWWILRALRELDLLLCRLRFSEPQLGLVLLRVRGSPEIWRTTDKILYGSEHWFVRETRAFAARTLKRLENTAKSFYAVADEAAAFVGTGLELALACDRVFALDDPSQPVAFGAGAANAGALPMANGLSRLATRFLGAPQAAAAVLSETRSFGAARASELGLVTLAPDAIDWEDELRLAIEERTSFSPDGLTGMEQNLRFAGPETMETKIFGRLSAWQNWIFQRPNAVGERGALSTYGTPLRPSFDTVRT
jgi:benzoyl-CoA-dihydrodiol lyase